MQVKINASIKKHDIHSKVKKKYFYKQKYILLLKLKSTRFEDIKGNVTLLSDPFLHVKFYFFNLIISLVISGVHYIPKMHVKKWLREFDTY